MGNTRSALVIILCTLKMNRAWWMRAFVLSGLSVFLEEPPDKAALSSGPEPCSDAMVEPLTQTLKYSTAAPHTRRPPPRWPW